jgi:hypothetical protein
MPLKFTAATVLAICLFVAATSHSQPGDTPIVISDGSLTINSRGLNSTWTKASDDLAHPNQRGAITNVTVTKGAATQFNGACNAGGPQCIIDIDYGRAASKGSLRVRSNQNSRSGVHINRTGFAHFATWQQTDSDTIAFEPNVHDGIAAVRIGGATFCNSGQGACKVVITYRVQ